MTQNPIAMFVIGLLFGLFIVSIPLSISVYANHGSFHLAHYLVLTGFSLLFGGIAAVQKEKFGDTIERVLNAITSG